MMRYLTANTLRLDEARCIGCGACVQVCPHAVFTLPGASSTGAARTVQITAVDACMECGACMRNCPVDALSVRIGVGCASGLLYQALGSTGSDCCCSQPQAAITPNTATPATYNEGGPMDCCSSPQDDTQILDPATTELIALGAAVAAHCQPCLTHHLEQARAAGLSAEQIAAAIRVGQMVAKGADSAMRSGIASALEQETDTSATDSGGCCNDGGGAKGGCCC